MPANQIYNTERHPWLRAGGGEAIVEVVFCQITKVSILGASIDDDICCGKQTDRKARSSVISAVSAGPVRRRFAYPPATAHMFGTWNSWTWPRAKMGQIDTDGEKAPTGSLSDD